ncbi:MAG: 30S ribosomal protein S1 [Bacteroidota bacterium]|nr:30S ribosomal protein S1 [Bacteroidota bacterium]
MTEEQLQNGNVSTGVDAATETHTTRTKTNYDAPAADDFDWSMDNAGFSNYNKAEHQEMVNLYTTSLKSLTSEELVKGSVVALNDKEVVINVGFKSDGIIQRSEFRDLPDLKVGDEVEVYLETVEDANGQLVLSRKRAILEKSWDFITKAMEEGTVLTGLVKTRTKGGLVVDLMGIDAFLPGSQIDVKPIKDYDQYVGKDMEFKIVKVNEVFKNVVISHKALIEDDIEAQKSDILSKLEKGQVLEGIVKNIAPFGVFVDLGGIDGLLHITDMSWGRISNPEEMVQLDDKITVVVLEFDEGKKRISLGMKQLSEHPWDKLGDSLKLGEKVKGKVVTVTDYGAFVELQPGVEGLIHVSEMSWSSHLRSPHDFLKTGDEIEAIITAIEKDEHKLSLGIKQLTQDPWLSIIEKYKVGSKHTGVVKNLTSYGLFVELEEGVDGLIHVSDLSWTKKIKHPSEFIKRDEKIEAVVLEVDSENRRLSLGHKQLEENPWDTFETIFFVNSKHEGTVVGLNDKGANVQLQYGIEGFAPKRHLVKENGGKIKDADVLTFEVIEFSKENKSIILSHTNTWKSEEKAKDEAAKDKTAKTVRTVNKNVEKTTLGELDAFSDLKAMFDSANVKDAVKKETKKVKAEKVEAVEETVSNNADDLKKINGVGPAFEKRLNDLGIFTYNDLIELTDEKIAELETKDSMTSLEQWHTWIEEAKTLKA